MFSLSDWWVWIVLGFALGVLEVIVPGYIFLGFAVGAVWLLAYKSFQLSWKML